jgi:hypothetical protein
MRFKNKDYTLELYGRTIGSGCRELASYSKKMSMKKGMIVGASLPLAGFLFSGVYTVTPTKAVAIVEYKLDEILPKDNVDPLYHLIALIQNQLPGGSLRIVEYRDNVGVEIPFVGKVGWHLPYPFGKHLDIPLNQEFNIKVPIIIPLYVKDENGMPILDEKGEPLIVGYNILTKDGFKLYNQQTLIQERYNPEFKLDVVKISVKGKFKVNELETYAKILKDSDGQKITWMKELGFYGEITAPPTANQQLEEMLTRTFQYYFLNIKLQAIVNELHSQYPNLSEEDLVKSAIEILQKNPEVITNPFNNVQGFEEVITSKEFIEATGLNIEKLFGIDILKEMEAKLFEEPL